MTAASDRPQPPTVMFRHRRLNSLNGAVGYLPISQIRYQNAEAKIKAGIRIATRSNFIADYCTASTRTSASSLANYSRGSKLSTAELRYSSRNCILPHKDHNLSTGVRIAIGVVNATLVIGIIILVASKQIDNVF